MNLTEFLFARIAEDERAIRLRSADGRLPAWLDTTRVLAKCEADRKIVEMGSSWCGASEEPDGWRDEFTRKTGFAPAEHYPKGYAAGCDGCAAAETADQDHERVLRFLALPYADHPDYREEWKP